MSDIKIVFVKVIVDLIDNNDFIIVDSETSSTAMAAHIVKSTIVVITCLADKQRY